MPVETLLKLIKQNSGKLTPMIKTSTSLLLILITSLMGGEATLINSGNRHITNLNGEWNYIVDPYENGYYNYRYEAFDQQTHPGKGAFFNNSKPADKTDLVEYDFDKSDVIYVPGDWNSQKEKLFYYEGSVWYKKSFDYKKANSRNRVFVRFGAVNYQADVYLNGEKLGTHVGGFTPFNYEVTNLLKDVDNFLVLKVDNKRHKEAVPTLNTDWWNYGGITRDVIIVEEAPTFIDDYLIQLNPENDQQIKGFIQLNGVESENQRIRLRIPQLGINKKVKTGATGRATFSYKIKNLRRWSPKTPHLYDVTLNYGDQTLGDRIGFRSIETRDSNILLNGKKIFLKGISIHEENPLRGGRAYSPEDAELLLNWAKNLGCNYVRLAHYPHNEYMVRLADEMGIMVWEEIPVYWTIDWNNPDTYKNAENQLTEVIQRDKNRSSVIIWSMANETPTSPRRHEFLGKLATHARGLDPTRLISAALEQSTDPNDPMVKYISDEFADVVDVLSFNEYIGWYDGTHEKCQKISWNITQNKPVIISEFGAGAKYGFHGDKLTRWSEEYQNEVYVETLKMLDKIPQLSGVSPWILADFRSPRRPLPDIQDGWNRKGLISDKGEKKQAFFTLQAYFKAKGD